MIAKARGSIYEQARPKSLSDLAGLRETVERLEQLDEAIGFHGQVFWLAGPSGCGKTTIARIIANKVAEPCCIEELDAQDVSLEKMREWEDRCQHTCLFGGGWAFIINEAHGLNTRAISRFQTLLEDRNVQKNGTFCFTTTDKGQQHLFDTKFDSLPFLSRALIIQLEVTDEDRRAMAEHVVKVADRFGLKKVSIERAYEFMQTTSNVRACLQAAASGAL